MPSTVNGIGTRYWGKGDAVVRRGTCEFCGRRTQIKSYDTTTYFTFFYVPLIPLGKKRVLDECGVCTKHRAVPLAKWDQAKRADLDAAADAATADRGNDEKAAKAVATAMGYQAREDFDLFAEEFGAALPNGPKTQATIGDGQVLFGRPELAEAAYRRSLAADDAEPTREALAVLLMRDNRPEEARPLLAHAFAAPAGEKVGPLVLLVEAYQAKGMHRDALAVLDELQAADPSLAEDREIGRLRKGSEKRLDSGKPMAPASLAPVGTTAGGSNLSGRLAKLVLPLGLAAAAVVYFGVAIYLGQSRKVYVVSGLPTGSTVSVAGKRIFLPPFGREEVRLAEGRVPFAMTDVKTADGGITKLAAPPQSVELHTPFLTRPFNFTTFVLNPDGAAILLREEEVYTPSTQTAPEAAETEVMAGEHLYAVASIDYAFKDAPATLKTEATKPVIKHVLTDYKPDDATDAVRTLLNHRDAKVAGAYLAARLAAGSDDPALPFMAATVLEPDAALAALKPGLDAVPLRMQWHRAYQNLLEREGKADQAAAEYRKRLDADPSNPQLAYLLGRITEDPAAARKLYLQAATANPPVALGRFALAFDALSDGRYPAALDEIDKAIAIDSEGDGFSGLRQEVLAALGRFRDALGQLRRDQNATGKPFRDIDAVELQVYLLTRAGDAAGAKAAKETFIAGVRKNAGPATGEYVRRDLEAITAYLKQDRESYRALLGGASLPGEPVPARLRYRVAITAGDPAAAKAAAAEIEGADVPSLLCVLYLCANQSKASDAAAYLAPAVNALRAGDRDERRVAAWLSSDADAPSLGTPPDPAAVDALAVLPEVKRVYLAAIGLRHPAIKSKCFELAKKYDYDTRFPHLLIADVIAGK